MKKTIIITLAAVCVVAGYMLLNPADKLPPANTLDEAQVEPAVKTVNEPAGLVTQNTIELPDDSVSAEPPLVLDPNEDIRAYIINLFSMIDKDERDAGFEYVFSMLTLQNWHEALAAFDELLSGSIEAESFSKYRQLTIKHIVEVAGRGAMLYFYEQ